MSNNLSLKDIKIYMKAALIRLKEFIAAIFILKVNDYIICGLTGVCQVTDITTEEIGLCGKIISPHR